MVSHPGLLTLTVQDVVKVGGSLARDPALLANVMRCLTTADPPPLVVPGGGSLADAVRTLHGLPHGPTEATAHLMALLALDQAALWLAELAGETRPGRVVRDEPQIAAAVAAGALPVLAPFQWIARDRPMPASWDVTSDSIAAWVAARIGARRLLLVKSFGFRDRELRPEDLGDAVDAFFLKALSPATECRLVDGRNVAALAAALGGEQPVGAVLRFEKAEARAGSSQ